MKGTRRRIANPSGLCQDCGMKIFNRAVNAEYCKSCIIKRIKVQQKEGQIKYKEKQKMLKEQSL